MARRVHVSAVVPGDVTLSEGEAHHVRDVLRFRSGDVVEVFDDAGATARGALTISSAAVTVRVDAVQDKPEAGARIMIASAVPRAARADWLIEKLSEIGVDEFIPVATARAVVVPEGKNKFERWTRIASESAKQCRRAGVMKISALASLDAAIVAAKAGGTAVYLSTDRRAEPLVRLLGGARATGSVTLFIGPEGDWSPEEVATFQREQIPGASLTRTILRIETAALAAAVLTACHLGL